MPKMVFLGSFWKLKAYVKQCYKTGHFQYYKKLMENAKSGQFWGIFEYLKLMSNSDTRHVNFDISKIDGKCQNWKKTFLVILKYFKCFKNDSKMNFMTKYGFLGTVCFR